MLHIYAWVFTYNLQPLKFSPWWFWNDPTDEQRLRKKPKKWRLQGHEGGKELTRSSFRGSLIPQSLCMLFSPLPLHLSSSVRTKSVFTAIRSPPLAFYSYFQLWRIPVVINFFCSNSWMLNPVLKTNYLNSWIQRRNGAEQHFHESASLECRNVHGVNLESFEYV